MGRVDRDIEASASDGVENLKITVEPAGLEEESEISAEEPADSLKRKESCASEEEVDADADLSLIRRLKKEALALIRKDSPDEADLPVKKKRKIIKQRVPQGLIDYLMQKPYKLQEISQERRAKHSQRFLDSYARKKAINDKVLEYEQALINQYLTKGYAEDEEEVTDDESDGN